MPNLAGIGSLHTLPVLQWLCDAYYFSLTLGICVSEYTIHTVYVVKISISSCLLVHREYLLISNFSLVKYWVSDSAVIFSSGLICCIRKICLCKIIVIVVPNIGGFHAVIELVRILFKIRLMWCFSSVLIVSSNCLLARKCVYIQRSFYLLLHYRGFRVYFIV